MPIPPIRVSGDSGHIQDHNDIASVLTGYETRIGQLETDFDLLPATADIATENYVDSAVSAAVTNIINSAPTALNTLDELAAALGDDANFASTVTNALSQKQPLDSDLTSIAGITDTSGLLKKVSSGSWSLDTTVYSTKSYVDTTFLPLSGGILSGGLSGTTASFTGTVSAANPTSNSHLSTKSYVDSTISTSLSSYLSLSGGTLTGILNGTSASFSGTVTVSAPTQNSHAATKQYVDSVAAGTLDNSINIILGSGLSGGGEVSLGESVTINNTGILSVSGTTNQISVSSSNGVATISLPNNITVSGNITAAQPTLSTHLATKGYVDGSVAAYAFATATVRGTWTGSLASSSDASAIGIVTVTFPAGRFTNPPVVICQNFDDGSASRMAYARFTPYSVTSSSVSLEVVNNAPSSTITGGGIITKAIVDILATQMSSGSSYG
jgi:hypothetical protein